MCKMLPRFKVETVATPDITLDVDSAGDEVDGPDEEVIVKRRTFYLNRFRRQNEQERSVSR